MRKPWVNLILFVALLGLSASFILITAFAQANSISTADSEVPNRSASPEALPLRFPIGDWPWYAQGEIYLNPEPPIPGSPAEICVKVANDDPQLSHIATLQFGVAPLGIGVPYNPIGNIELEVPAAGIAMGCTMWVSPEPGQWGIEVLLFQEDAQEPLRSLRNIDLWEPLVPGETHDLVFPVGPLGAEGTLTFQLTPYLPGWEFEIIPSQINITNPDQVFAVTLKTTPPREVVLGSGSPIVDVEGLLNDQSIGGFRKVDSPPVPLHIPIDPLYAEREITIDPYPPLAGEPTEICVELRNPTPFPQEVLVQFSWASFGIGLPFTPINGPIPVSLPPYSLVKTCIHWVPPISGHLCLQVILEVEGYAPQVSQRNTDVNEPLQPGVAHSLTFPVGNPLPQSATITLGMIPHMTNWAFELYQDVLLDMAPG